MTTEPHSPSDQPAPAPQQGKATGGPGAESVDEGLWDLEHPDLEDADGPPPPAIAPAPIKPKAVGTDVSPRQAVEPTPIPPTPIRLPGTQTSVMRRISKADYLRSSRPPQQPLNPAAQLPGGIEPDFDDLEDWAIDELPDEPGPAPDAVLDRPPASAAASSAASAPPQPARRPDPSLLADLQVLADLPEVSEVSDLPAAAKPVSAGAPGATVPPPESKASAAPAAPADAGDEFSFKPAAKPVARGSRRRPKLSVVEMTGLAVLLVLLVAGGVWAYRQAAASILEREHQGGTKLPAKGEFLTVSRIESYWRAPITSGEQRESVRLGVTLIPVAEVTVSGQGTIRALFSDDTGTNVGDPVDRRIDGETTITVPCTSGFKELAEHRAYQVDLIKAWHIRLLEAPAPLTTGQAFKPLATAPVSSTLK